MHFLILVQFGGVAALVDKLSLNPQHRIQEKFMQKIFSARSKSIPTSDSFKAGIHRVGYIYLKYPYTKFGGEASLLVFLPKTVIFFLLSPLSVSLKEPYIMN